MIESLNQEQEDKLPLYKEKWIKIALSTKPIDVEQAKYWITKAYEQSGLNSPTEWKVFDSPLACTKYQSEHILTDQVIGQVYYQVSDQVYFQVRDQIRDQVYYQVWDQVYDDLIPVNIRFGPFLGQYDFYLNELKLDCVKPLKPFIELAKYCGWWMPHEKTCLLTHKPTEINLNAENLLHNENGPSVLHRDGFSVWSLNGVIVDEQLVLHPETQTIEQINKEPNEDRRSLRIERFGWNRYIEESGATIIESGPNDIDTTHEILARTPVGLRLLTLCPSTGRVYSLGIGDSGVSTCLGAQQWLWGNKSFRFVGRT